MSYIVQHIRSTEEGRRPQASQLAEGQFALNVNDASPGVFLKTTEDKVVKVGGVSVGSEAPLAVFNNEYSVGELWYNTNTGDLNVYDGSVWKTTSSQTLSTASATLQDRITLLESDRATASAVTIGDATTLTAAKEYVDDFFTTFNAQLASKLDVSSALSNIADGAQGVEVTGRVAAEGLDLSVGGQITAAGCSVDFQSATINFSGATISGLSDEIRDNVDLHLNQSTATDGQILSWNATGGDYEWVSPAAAGAETDTLDTVTGRGATTLNDITVGKCYFGNVFSVLGDLPSAATHHGMFAHVHSTGHGYFAHNGNWTKLANHSELPAALTQSDILTLLDVNTYADNAAAAYAGLATGDVYYNSTTSKLASVTA